MESHMKHETCVCDKLKHCNSFTLFGLCTKVSG